MFFYRFLFQWWSSGDASKPESSICVASPSGSANASLAASGFIAVDREQAKLLAQLGQQ
jgi:hypothetical protein